MIKQDSWQGQTIYLLENNRLAVSLVPSINNNVYQIYDKTLQREVLSVPESPEQLLERPVHFGTPILMPPNRIRNGRFTFDGREYQFDVKPETGHHSHGVLRALPWKAVHVSSCEGIDAITSLFNTADHPDVMRQYPHDLTLEVIYELAGSSLIHKLRVANHGTTTAPFGYGLHTWFQLDHAPDKWTLQLPVDGVWELDEGLMPTERILPLGDEYAGLAEGINLKGRNLDTVFRIGDREAIAELLGPGCNIKYSGSKQFKHWVIYTKGEADNDICLEPYTWVTNAPNLSLDPELTGLIGIKPGEQLTLQVVLDITYP
ncbi:aldose epimerase [Gordoniibacillus kamchatkensis]|uniref:Aldose epimerase n=1 Tax=Gordoniibacillus kamchatkensis TaxID=1590651 RepID=A0ABR5AN23_9BACL|nr:aldose 1-epimerase [Paenibacillus sp. VKM B-2647]KIL42421.1 aldose epimerase [Paenibacillus sp. VKM B-2647]